MRQCMFCGEDYDPDKETRVQGVHDVCGFRMMAGSIAHQLKRCGCYVEGSDESDPSTMTVREAAELALAVYKNGGQLPPGRLTELYLASRPVDAGEPIN